MKSFRHLLSFWRNLIIWIIRYPVHSSTERFLILFDYLRLYQQKRLSTEEYYEFNFEKQDSVFKKSFLGSVEQGLYLLKLNPVRYYSLARNKFLAHLVLESAGIPMPKLLGHYNPLADNSDKEIIDLLVRLKRDGKLPCVIKATESSHGDGVYVVKDIMSYNEETELVLINEKKVSLDSMLARKDEFIIEEVIKQSKQFESFNKTSVNTVRFMTTLYPGGDAKIIAAFIKFGREGAFVDNAGSGGNLDACVDVESGTIMNSIEFEGFRKFKDVDVHPDSGTPLNGTVIEKWEDIKCQVINFQKKFPFIKAAGWDVAITDDGPVVIEVNDSWDRTGQLFIRKGWRSEIQSCYLAWKNVDYDPKVERGSNKLTPTQIDRYEKIFLMK